MQAHRHTGLWRLPWRHTFTDALDQTLKHSRYFFRKCNYVIESVAIKILLIAGEIELRTYLAAGTLCNQQEAGKVWGTAAFESLGNV